MKIKNLKLILFFSSMLIFSCNTDITKTNLDKKVITTINNNAVIKNITNITETVKNIMEIEYKDINTNDIRYEIGNPLLASIDENGNLTPLATGIVEIKVIQKSSNQVLKSINVKVQVESDKQLPTPILLLEPSDKVTLVSEKGNKWESSNNSAIDLKDGSIEAKSAGRSNISVLDNLENKLYNLQVSVKKPVKNDFKILFKTQNISSSVSKSQVFSINSDGTNQILIYEETVERENLNSPGGLNTAKWSPDNSKISFCSGKNGSYEIFVMNADGSNQIQLTKNLNATFPQWSPDGSKIVFHTDKKIGSEIHHEIYVMNSDGSNQIQLTNDNSKNSYFPQWSLDGSKIIFSREPTPQNRITELRNTFFDTEIYLMNADGTNQTNITNNSKIDDMYPNLSPDGSKVVFESFNYKSPNQIYLLNINGSGLKKLNDENTGGKSPIWSPDGNKVLFHQSDSSGSTYGLYTTNPDGSNKTKITNSITYPERIATYYFGWAPDSRKIIFEADYSAGDDLSYTRIYVINADGTNQVKLVNITRKLGEIILLDIK